MEFKMLITVKTDNDTIKITDSAGIRLLKLTKESNESGLYEYFRIRTKQGINSMSEKIVKQKLRKDLEESPIAVGGVIPFSDVAMYGVSHEFSIKLSDLKKRK